MGKVVVTMPDDLLQEVDSAARETRRNRSQFFREALTLYLEEQKRRKFEALMAEGYLEMAEEDAADAMGYIGTIDLLENQENG